MAEATKRVRRSKEQLIKDLEAQVEKENKAHEARIQKLKEKVELLKNPPKKKLTKTEKMKKINAAIKAAKLSPEEIVKKLGLDVEF